MTTEEYAARRAELEAKIAASTDRAGNPHEGYRDRVALLKSTLDCLNGSETALAAAEALRAPIQAIKDHIAELRAQPPLQPITPEAPATLEGEGQ